MIIVLTTYPDLKTAKKFARKLVEEELAACINVIKIEQSVYRWKGKIKEGDEYQLVIKTTQKAYKQVEHMIKDNHPYELCEIIWFEVNGERNYERWIESDTLTKLLRVPLDLRAFKRKAESAKKPKTLS